MILELPLEIVELIVLKLPYDDILKIGTCSKQLNEVTQCQSLWEKCANRDFNVNLKCTKSQNCSTLKEEEVQRSFSARIFYRNILRQYGKALHTTWQRTNYEFYGGLVKLLYHNYMLYLVELEPPPYPSIYKSLQTRVICQIFVTPDSNETLINYLEYKPVTEEDHTVSTVKYSMKLENNEVPCTMSLVSNPYPLPEVLKLNNDWYDIESDDGKEMEMSKRLGIPRDMARLRFKHQMLYILEGNQQFRAITTSHATVAPTEYPIQPGLFKATYGSHGIEIIQLHYLVTSKEIIGLKITGDPNVPFGEVSFKGYLDKPITGEMMVSGQEGIGYFEQLRHSFDKATRDKKNDDDITNDHVYDQNLQPFELPKSFWLSEELQSDGLKEYKCRFAAKIQIAMAGFHDPRFVDAHLLIFSENTIAVINIDLKSLKICHRIDQRLNDIVNYEDLFTS